MNFAVFSVNIFSELGAGHRPTQGPLNTLLLMNIHVVNALSVFRELLV